MRFGNPLIFFTGLCLSSALTAFANPYADLAKQLTADMHVFHGKRVAVVPFCDPAGQISPAGTAVALSVESAMADVGGVDLVERTLLRQIVEELELQYSGLASSDSAMGLGRIARADLLVVGTVVGSKRSKADVHARLVRVETGEILRSAKSRINGEWPQAKLPPAGSSDPMDTRSPRLHIETTSMPGAIRSVDGRSLAFRYSHDGRGLVARITDISEAWDPAWTEIRLPLASERDACGAFAANFRLSGRKYRLWTDSGCDIHLAPRGNILSEIFLDGVIRGEEVVVAQESLRRAWQEDIEKHSQLLAFSENRTLSAYAEPVRDRDVRVSLLMGLYDPMAKRIESYMPSDVEVLRGSTGETVNSRLLAAGSKHFRFHYATDSRSVAVERADGD